jgi:hypothetical protein
MRKNGEKMEKKWKDTKKNGEKMEETGSIRQGKS